MRIRSTEEEPGKNTKKALKVNKSQVETADPHSMGFS